MRVFVSFYAVFVSFYAVFVSFYAVLKSFYAVFISFYAVFVLKRIDLQDAASLPMWLQLVGTGIMTTWAAHFGAVLPAASWPAITVHNILESQLLTDDIRMVGGFHRVPDAPGLVSSSVQMFHVMPMMMMGH